MGRQAIGRQLLAWMLFVGSFWMSAVFPLTTHSGIFPWFTHSCRCSYNLGCSPGSVLNQKPWTRSGPATFQFAILLTSNSNFLHVNVDIFLQLYCPVQLHLAKVPLIVADLFRPYLPPNSGCFIWVRLFCPFSFLSIQSFIKEFLISSKLFIVFELLVSFIIISWF